METCINHRKIILYSGKYDNVYIRNADFVDWVLGLKYRGFSCRRIWYKPVVITNQRNLRIFLRKHVIKYFYHEISILTKLDINLFTLIGYAYFKISPMMLEWLAGTVFTRISVQMSYPESKDHGPSMGPTWVLSAPGRPHVGSMNLTIRVFCYCGCCESQTLQQDFSFRPIGYGKHTYVLIKTHVGHTYP